MGFNPNKIAVLGQGYAGLPVALAFAEANKRVLAVDTDRQRVDRLMSGRSPVEGVPDERVQRAVRSGRYRVVRSYEAVHAAEAVLLCVPTPLRKTREPDLSYVREAVEGLAEWMEPPCLVVVESTVFPGATDSVVAPALEGDGWELDENLWVAHSPERIDPGNEEWGLANTPKIVGGVTEASTERAVALYEEVVDDVVAVDGAREAELAKLMENTYRSVNVALANEMAVMADHLGVDVWEAIEAAATKPFGFEPFWPGPGTGGDCLPTDPRYLSWRAEDAGYTSRFLELAHDRNAEMPRVVVDRLERMLDERGVTLRGAEVLLLGMAYKAGVGDVRESPALEVWRRLEERGAELSYHDPHVSAVGPPVEAESRELTDELLEAQEAVCVLTGHEEVDYGRVVECGELVFDTRGVVEDAGNVRALGR